MASKRNRERRKAERKSARLESRLLAVPIYHGIGKRGPISWNERNSPDTGRYLVSWHGGKYPSGGRFYASLHRAIEMRDRLMAAIGRIVTISTGDIEIGTWHAHKYESYPMRETPQGVVEITL